MERARQMQDTAANLARTMNQLELGISARMASMAQRLVSNKYLLDKVVAEDRADMLAGELHDQGYGPAEAWSFLPRVLPFMQENESQGESFFALVPTAHTLGCSWKWRKKHLSPEAISRVTRLSDAEAMRRGELNEATYFWIQPLGLVAPIEGKNRVDFFREQGIEFIPAKVIAQNYPAPTRLRIYPVRRHGFEQTWAVLDGRWLQRLSHPSWTLPLLEAYGVQSSPWPSDFPDPALVEATFFEWPGPASALGHPPWSDRETVDLHTLAAEQLHGDEILSAALLQLDNVKVDRRLWFAAGGAALVGMACLALAPVTWDSLRVTASFIFGSAFGAAMLPFLDCIKAPRRALAHQDPLPADLNPKIVSRRRGTDRLRRVSCE
jgi:hypothetical protein